MSYWIFITPLITAFFGWLIHQLAASCILQKNWPKIFSQLSESADSLADSHFSFDQIEQKITDPIILDKAMPSIEKHIDAFLNEKLQQEIPMLSMFVGTKTTEKIKDIFINQLRQLFPTVMAQMAGDLKENFNIKSLISEQLNNRSVQQSMKSSLAKQLKTVPLLGLITGFIAGLISIAVFYLAGYTQ